MRRIGRHVQLVRNIDGGIEFLSSRVRVVKSFEMDNQDTWKPVDGHILCKVIFLLATRALVAASFHPLFADEILKAFGDGNVT